MRPIRFKTLYRPEHFEFSGPEFWPSLKVESAADRFIFRRPEVPYQIALEQINEVRATEDLGPAEVIHIAIKRVVYPVGGQAKRKQFATFAHTVNTFDKADDIRRFLEELRMMLSRHLPNKPLPTSSIELSFSDRQTGQYGKLKWMEDWL